MTTGVEVLDPRFKDRDEAAPVVQRARTHFREMKRSAIQVMADLAELHDREVHLLYGEPNFAEWAAATFDELSAASVKQLVRGGKVAKELARTGRINLSTPTGVGTTGLRELSAIMSEYGVGKMLQAYDRAKEIVEGGKDISAATVKTSMKLLMPPAPAKLETPEALTDEGEDDGDEGETGEEERARKYGEQATERMNRLQDLCYDLPESLAEMGEELERLRAELAGVDIPADSDWLSSGR